MGNFNSGRQPSIDRFGNAYSLVSCKDKKGTGFSKGWVEIGGKLYKIEPSEAAKDGVMYWVKITKMNSNQNTMHGPKLPSSMRF